MTKLMPITRPLPVDTWPTGPQSTTGILCPKFGRHLQAVAIAEPSKLCSGRYDGVNTALGEGLGD